MFSATFSPEITRLAKNFLRPNPTVVEVARQNQTAETVTQETMTAGRTTTAEYMRPMR